MRVMIDTNILVSALLFPASVPARVLFHAAQAHELVLCDHIADELRDVIFRKRPDLLADAEVLLAELSYEMVIAPREPSKLIPDPKDYPILNAAIMANVDVIVSGDNHFLSLAIEHPRPITAAQYLELFTSS